jgi:hypothetical protein
MTILVRLQVRPLDGAPVNREGVRIGTVVRSREGADGAWETELQIDDDEVKRQFEQQFPRYDVREIR